MRFEQDELVRIARLGSLCGIIVGGSLGEDESIRITWDTSGGHLGGIGEGPGSHLGGIWETSGRDLAGIWETSGRPGGARGPGRHLGADCVHLPVFYQPKWRDRASRVHGTSSTFTLIGNLQQLSAAAHPPRRRAGLQPASKTNRQNPYSVNTVWGIFKNQSEGCPNGILNPWA